ncbi:MAG: hypothetical protein COA73_05970 [Candidatus Hydrogenedentota bacterium]|nr:MAG: hypothetical protein COA73_05970 [Candidatus Hydrogenedentota bacterium]
MIQGILHSISGMLSATRKTEATAQNIANINTPGFQPIRTDSNGNQVRNQTVPDETNGSSVNSLDALPSSIAVPPQVNLATEMTNLLINQRAFEANVNALKMQDEALGDLLDLSE